MLCCKTSFILVLTESIPVFCFPFMRLHLRANRKFGQIVTYFWNLPFMSSLTYLWFSAWETHKAASIVPCGSSLKLLHVRGETKMFVDCCLEKSVDLIRAHKWESCCATVAQPWNKRRQICKRCNITSTYDMPSNFLRNSAKIFPEALFFGQQLESKPCLVFFKKNLQNKWE